MYRRSWLIVSILFIATAAGAHPGHGFEEAGVAHQLSDPVHVGPLVLLLGIAATIAMLRSRGITRVLRLVRSGSRSR